MKRVYGTLTMATQHCSQVSGGIAIRFIKDGCVFLNGKRCIKPDHMVVAGDIITEGKDKLVITEQWLERYGTR